MAHAFRVVVPSPGRRTMGMLRPAGSARGGVLLVEDASAHSPLAHVIYTEVELYLQAAGFNTLSLSLPASVDIGTRASCILGGVSMLRSLHRDKIVLITTTPPHTVSQAEERAESVAALLHLAARDARSLPDTLRVVRDLTVTIRDVAESVIGVAALIAPPLSTRAETAFPRRDLPRTLPVSPGPGRAGRTSLPASGPASLRLPLPAADDATPMSRTVAQLVSRLYIWTLSLMRQPQPATTQPAPVLSPRSPLSISRWREIAAAQTNWHEHLRWADEQWAALLARLMRRDPARSALVHRAALPAGGDGGYSIRSARLAWQYLTWDECQTWLQVCNVVFQQRPLPRGVADPRAG